MTAKVGRWRIFRRSGDRFAAENATTKGEPERKSDSTGTEFALAPAAAQSRKRLSATGSRYRGEVNSAESTWRSGPRTVA
jgi:hypothetical protein